MFRVIASLSLGLCAVVLIGCGDKNKSTTPTTPEFKNKDGHDHSDHAGGKEDATLPDGKQCHAVLSAHFSKKGEKALEVSFETQKDAKPLTVPEKTKVSLRVQRGEEIFNLELKPGPKDERKSDAAGQCSRFEADADWLKPDDKLTAVTLTIEGVTQKTVWTDFEVKKYTHTHDD